MVGIVLRRAIDDDTIAVYIESPTPRSKINPILYTGGELPDFQLAAISHGLKPLCEGLILSISRRKYNRE